MVVGPLHPWKNIATLDIAHRATTAAVEKIEPIAEVVSLR